MSELTVGDIRPFLDLALLSPIFSESETIASSLRNLLGSVGAPITPETDAALTIIEANPILIEVGFAEFRAAIEGLPDETLLTEISGLPGTDAPVGGGDGPVGGDPVTDENGNLVGSFELPFSGIEFVVSGDTVTVIGDGINEELVGLDRITFSDGVYYLDGTEAPGLVRTAYDALLGRDTPDGAGFDFWVDAIEADAANLFALTEDFVRTDAFQTAYGDALDNAGELVSRVYENLLGRAADAEGSAFWTGYIEANGLDVVDEVFAFFLQSEELQNRVTENFSDGFFI
jgi:hypothetical protein